MKITKNDRKFAVAVVIVLLVVALATWYYWINMDNPGQQNDVSQKNIITAVVPTTVMPTATPTTVMPTVAPIFMDDYLAGETCDNRNTLNGEEAIKIMQFFETANRTLNSDNILNAEDIVDRQLLQQLNDRKKRVSFVPGKIISQMVVSTRQGVVVMKNVTATALPAGNKAYRLWIKDPMTKNGNIYVIAVYNCQNELVSTMQVSGGVTQKIQGSPGSSDSSSDTGGSETSNSGTDSNDDGGDQESGGPVDVTV